MPIIRCWSKPCSGSRVMSSRIVLLFAVLVLAGCQTLPRAVPPVGDGSAPEVAFAERQALFANIDAWTLRGRSALSNDGRGWNGTVSWEQRGTTMDLRFLAPLGAGTLLIQGDADSVRVQASDGTDFLTTDPDIELAHFLGVEVPVTAMRWWVLGVPVPDVKTHALELDEAGRMVRMVQSGWSVSYPRYSERGGQIVPGIVVAERDGTRVRLIIDRWEHHD